ncbi:MAG: hypothetical protein JO227_06835 [Acetobacteraceae bacterium]|nr:hypothetical protein [Acetobacteraceae bacterium]
MLHGSDTLMNVAESHAFFDNVAEMQTVFSAENDYPASLSAAHATICVLGLVLLARGTSASRLSAALPAR